MTYNILHAGKLGVIRDALNMNNSDWKSFKDSRTYLEANWIPAQKQRRRRVVSPIFKIFDWLDVVTKDYSPELTCWHTSFKHHCSAISEGVADNIEEEVSSFQSYLNSRNTGRLIRAETMSLQNRPIFFKNSDSEIEFKILKISNIQEVGSTSSLNNILGTFLVVRFGNSQISKHDVPNCAFPLQRRSDQFPTQRTLLFFRLKEVFSDFGTLEENPRNEVAFRDLFYIRANVPSSYDSSFNKQMWLPLTTGEWADSWYAGNETPVTRITNPIWALRGYTEEVIRTKESDPKGQSRNASPAPGSPESCRFIGTVYGEDGESSKLVKHDLFDYEFTTDEEYRGKGKIFVDSGDICYCPLTGYELESFVDYRPMVNDECEGLTYSIA